MPSKRQTYATDPIESAYVFEQQAHQIPADPLEALMQTVPGDSPEESWAEKQERYEPLRDALDHVLSEREVWVIEGLFWRRLGLRSVAAELGLSKTQVARIRDNALEALKQHLGETIL